MGHGGEGDKENILIQYKTLHSYEAFSEWKAQEERLTHLHLSSALELNGPL